MADHANKDVPETIAIARAEKLAYAQQLGIDDALIERLVDTFYARVREHAVLGPIFLHHVKDWPAHLAKMRGFWGSIAIESGRYDGRPLPPHIAIGHLEADHFREWLTLFFKTLDDIMPNPQAHRFFGERAARIADSLLMGIEVDRGVLRPVRSPSPE